MTMVSDDSERKSRVLGQRGASEGHAADAARVERYAEIGYEGGWRPAQRLRGLAPPPWDALRHDQSRSAFVAFARAILAAVEAERAEPTIRPEEIPSFFRGLKSAIRNGDREWSTLWLDDLESWAIGLVDRMRALERVGRAGIAWRAAEDLMDEKLDDDTTVAGEQFTTICNGFYASLAELRAAIDALAALPPATTGGEGENRGE